jgi:hypothetical protein
VTGDELIAAQTAPRVQRLPDGRAAPRDAAQRTGRRERGFVSVPIRPARLRNVAERSPFRRVKRARLPYASGVSFSATKRKAPCGLWLLRSC